MVLAAGRDGHTADATALPASVQDPLASAAAEADPHADLRFDAPCPDYGHRATAVLDIASTLWAELDTWARGTLPDVHLLATSYGWSEPEILAWTPLRATAVCCGCSPGCHCCSNRRGCRRAAAPCRAGGAHRPDRGRRRRGHRSGRRRGAPTQQLPMLVNLTVWERLVTAVEEPSIQESALGALLPDTAGRLRLVWQVPPIRPGDGLDVGASPTPQALREAFATWAAARSQPASRIAVRAQRPPQASDDPCITDPEARYRGPDNQLYRVELVDDASLQRGIVHPLLEVTDVDTTQRLVRLSGEPPAGVGRLAERHPYLRRWDHREHTGADGAVPVVAGQWLELEAGPRVHYAPLAWVRDAETVQDLRLTFTPLAG